MKKHSPSDMLLNLMLPLLLLPTFFVGAMVYIILSAVALKLPDSSVWRGLLPLLGMLATYLILGVVAVWAYKRMPMFQRKK